eukprot:2626016-Rhodomonas_salina.2
MDSHTRRRSRNSDWLSTPPQKSLTPAQMRATTIQTAPQNSSACPTCPPCVSTARAKLLQAPRGMLLGADRSNLAPRSYQRYERRGSTIARRYSRCYGRLGKEGTRLRAWR